ncbi:MAG: DUF2948 family protein, partial [Alphaproteobacteria bacterium]
AKIECYSRCNFGVTFETVTGVKSRGIDLAERGRIFSLLAIKAAAPAADSANGGAAIELLFAGDAGIRLELQRILAHGQDMGEPWPTRWRPHHPGVEAA